MQFWRVTPSGAQVEFVTSQLYFRVTPVLGFLVSKSVAILKPFPQQALVKGEFVQAGSATKLEIAEEELELKVAVETTEVEDPEEVVEALEDDEPTDDDFEVEELVDDAFEDVLALLVEDVVWRFTRPSRSFIGAGRIAAVATEDKSRIFKNFILSKLEKET